MLSYWVSRAWLRLFGWKIHGDAARHRKFVLIAAPHTSNWDFPFMLATAYVMRVRISWFGKHTLFKPPWGWLLRKLGGFPVDRRASRSLVRQMAERFNRHDDLVLAVPPEGTRRKVEVWKSGFYHIALESGVPIGLGYLDYDRKLCGLGMFVMPSGNVKEDMDKIRDFYRTIRGKYPEQASEPRLREEAPSSMNRDRLRVGIRRESMADRDAIRSLTARAFSGHSFSDGTEPRVIDALRDAHALALSLVATRREQLIGHVAFSEVGPAKPSGWFALGPVSVEPSLQRRGVGSQLIEAGLQTLREQGANGCVVLGDHRYYQRFGFVVAPAWAPPQYPVQHFQILRFGDSFPETPVVFHPAFSVSADGAI